MKASALASSRALHASIPLRVYNGKTTGFHACLDMAAPKGTPVAAAADGRVALAGDLYFSGGTVLLDHGGGLFTQYMHLSRVDVKDGDAVARGTILGLVGATGRVTGPHLHWGARLNGARVNPEALVALPARPAPAVSSAPVSTLNGMSVLITGKLVWRKIGDLEPV